MSTASVDEAYFLVRVGSWTQEDLERWVAEQIVAALDKQYEQVKHDIKEEERYNQYKYDYNQSYRNPWGRGDL